MRRCAGAGSHLGYESSKYRRDKLGGRTFLGSDQNVIQWGRLLLLWVGDDMNVVSEHSRTLNLHGRCAFQLPYPIAANTSSRAVATNKYRRHEEMKLVDEIRL